MDPIDRRLLLSAAGIAGVAALSKLAPAARGGPLDPPTGPIAPSGRTLDEVYARIARTDVGIAEPRAPVQSLPGSKSAVHVISEPGSYYLTADIQGGAGMNGIEIAADNVSLDLAGFVLQGVPTALNGIIASGSRRAIHVGNGIIQGFPACGVSGETAESTTYRNLIIVACAGVAAIHAGPHTLITSCLFQDVSRGVRALNGSLIRDCTARDCVNHGFYTLGNTLLINCHATRCGLGLWSEFGGRIEACYAGDCGVGIQAGFDSVVEGCAIVNCSESSIVANGSGNTILSNRIRGAAPLDIAAGNSHGPIVNIAGIGDISTVIGANHPAANLVF